MHGHAADPAGFASLTVMWFAMIAAMMTPAIWPWVLSFHRFSGREPGAASTAQFVSGYAIAWLGYAIAATIVQLLLQRAGALSHATLATTPAIGAMVFLAAGVYQFAPLKRACLTHCRSPLSFFLTRWRNGPSNSIRLGVLHGVYCVGCCWALMATAFAVGVMNLWWMAALAVIAALEQIGPHAQKARWIIGVSLIAAGTWKLW